MPYNHKSILQKIRITFTLLVLILFNISVSFPQSLSVNKIEPPNWWIGMKWNKIQLMVYGENLSNANVKFDDEILEVTDVHYVENSSYLFIDVLIPHDIPQGNYTLKVTETMKRLPLSTQF